MRRSFDDSAVSPIVGFIIATVIFSASFYYVMDSAIQQDPKRDQATEFTAVAASLADIVMENGRGWYSAGACIGSNPGTLTPENVAASGRFGLGDENCGRSLTDPGARNNLSFEKFRNLYQAKMNPDALNGKVDYREARESLALTGENIDFHIRTWPVLASVREVLGTSSKDPLMRPGYIGDYATVGGTGLNPPNPIVTEYTDSVKVVLSINNNGQAPTMFTVVVEIKLKDGNIGFNTHTSLVGIGGTDSVEFTLRKTSDWDWKAQKEVTYQVWDKNAKLWPTSGGAASISLSAIDMTQCGGSTCAQRRIIVAESDRMYYTLVSGTVDVEYHYLAFTGKGVGVLFNDWDYVLSNGVTSTLTCGQSPACQTTAGSVITSVTPTPPAPDSTTYSATLRNDANTEVYNQVKVNVVTAAPGAFVPSSGASSYSPASSVTAEIRYIDVLIDQFDPNVINVAYDHANVPCAYAGSAGPPVVPAVACGAGDVFPDLRDVMNNDLKTALTDASGNPTTTKYTTLFVGSNVDHNAMTSQQAKGTIRDWVFAGGTLVVMGSVDQSVTWLEPIFHASLDTGSGGIYTPDQTHAALNIPNQLDYTTYSTGSTWSYNAGEGDAFTHVVTQGTNNDILGIGNPGAFGLGKVILTSWKPYALTANQATTCAEPLTSATNCQALFVVQNLITLSYRELYLDYGPMIPVGEPTGAQLRVGSVWHPELKQLVGIQMQIFAFPGGS